MKRIKLVFPAFFMLIACSGADTTEDSATAETTNEEVVEEEEIPPQPVYNPDTTAEETIVAYLEEKGWTGERHESGMYVVVDEEGEGDKPTLLHEVTIFYKGYLLDGTQFDGTEAEPATFPLNGLIMGWQLGIPYFGKGGKGKLIIPPGLGYGASGSGPIPPNATLMFEIELIDFQKATQPRMYF